MGLETGTYIDDLVSTNPIGDSDPKSEGDDHLRLIKSVLKNTFPSAGRAVYFENVPAEKTTAYTVQRTDERALLLANTATAAFTVTLPAGASVFAGFMISVMKSDASANELTIATAGAETINGNAASLVIRVRYYLLSLMWDGSEWKILSGSNVVTLRQPLAADPTAAAATGFLYTKTVSGKVELFWRDEDGNIIQFTAAGEIVGFAAVQTAIQQQSYVYATDTGSANSIEITPTPAVSALVEGMRFSTKVANANTGAVTVTVGTASAIALKKGSDLVDLFPGDLVAGQVIQFEFDGTVMQLVSPLSRGEAQAWINFNGATPTILSSYNIAGFNRRSVGDFDVTFTVPFTDGNYVCTAVKGGIGSAMVGNILNQLPNEARITFTNIDTGALADPVRAHCVFFGELA